MNAVANSTKTITNYGGARTIKWAQEIYETSSRDAGVRAKQLRKLGYKVIVSSLGMQVTSVGYIKMTMVDIRPGTHLDLYNLPEVNTHRL